MNLKPSVASSTPLSVLVVSVLVSVGLYFSTTSTPPSTTTANTESPDVRKKMLTMKMTRESSKKERLSAFFYSGDGEIEHND